MIYLSTILRMEVSATPVIGPEVSGDCVTSRKGARYSIGATCDQSARRQSIVGTREHHSGTASVYCYAV